jgi:putative lipoic acid-binding regulatory protein
MNFCGFGDAELAFPVEVHFRVIAFADAGTEAEVRAAAEHLGLGGALTPGNVSAGGKYHTFNLTVTVESAERMGEIDRAFRAVPGVKMVL